LAERLDALQATNASTFGNINASLQRLEANMLSTDNHLFTTQGHQQATDKDFATFKRDINKRFDELENSQARMEDSHARLKTRMVDSHAMLNERIEDSNAMIHAMKAEQATLSTNLDQVISSLDNSARQRHRSRSRSSRSSSHSNHVDDHVRLQQPRPPPHTHPQHDAPRRETQERP
jgi:chromosome segregation ATPase